MQHGGPKEHPTGKTIQVTNDLLYPPLGRCSSDTPQHAGRQQAEEKGDEKYDEKRSEFVANQRNHCRFFLLIFQATI